jgi:site-specific DNA recombinase
MRKSDRPKASQKMRKPDRPKAAQIFRCAIYTRKSSDEGLEQEFNSLDAQRVRLPGSWP